MMDLTDPTRILQQLTELQDGDRAAQEIKPG